MWNKRRYFWQLQNHVWIKNFRGEKPKIYHTRKILVFLHGLTIWKVMPRNVWNDIVSWQTRLLNNSRKFLLHASMIIISQKKNWNLQENCQKYPLKLFWSTCTWHVLEQLIFSDQWTNLHDRLRNGLRSVTNDWIVWYLTFITHVNTYSVVMWIILLNNADWDCFKTPILREILRTQNLLRMAHCAFLEVIHLFQ